jgi:hypothetical protein
MLDKFQGLERFIEHRLFPRIFFLVLLLTLLIHNDHISLWEQDESAYAGFARRMISTGDWLIPDYPWSAIHRKTPLHFWNIAVSFLFLGESNFALRFSSALSIWLVYYAIYRLGKGIFGELEVRISLIILASSLLINTLAKIAVTDGTYLLFNTLAALALIRHIHTGGNWKNTFLFWASISMALLVKGPPILLFIGVLGIILLLIHPERLRLMKLHPWFFFPLALIPLLAWGRAAWLRDDGFFVSWLFEWYILRRITGSVFGQTAPPGAYYLLISVAFLPYLYLQPLFWKTAIRETIRRNGQYLLLFCWFVAAWLPFEFSPSKLPAYTAAAHIPFAMILAKVMAAGWYRFKPRSWLFYFQIVLQTLLICAFPAAVFLLELSLFFKITSVLFAFGLLILIVLLFKAPGIHNGRLLTLNLSLTVFIWCIVYGQIDPVKNTPESVGLFLKGRYREAVVGNSEGHPPGIFVYAERHIGRVRLMTNTDTLRQLVPLLENAAFILSEKQWEELRNDGMLKLDTTICGHFTDRKGKACYFIASRK